MRPFLKPGPSNLKIYCFFTYSYDNLEVHLTHQFVHSSTYGQVRTFWKRQPGFEAEIFCQKSIFATTSHKIEMRLMVHMDKKFEFGLNWTRMYSFFWYSRNSRCCIWWFGDSLRKSFFLLFSNVLLLWKLHYNHKKQLNCVILNPCSFSTPSS